MKIAILDKSCELCGCIFNYRATKRNLTRRFCSSKCSSTFNGTTNGGKKRSEEWKIKNVVGYLNDKHKCSKCGLKKLKSEFNKRVDRSIGIYSSCKTCCKANKKIYKPITIGKKICTKCLILKDVTMFFAANHIKNGRSSECKTCSNIRKLDYLHNSPTTRIVENLRRRTRAVLVGSNKSNSTIKLIGCSPEELKCYLESKFSSGMSWDNYGDWHIDHIVPCATYDLSKADEQSACFHYTNLQPLWAKDNLTKGDRI